MSPERKLPEGHHEHSLAEVLPTPTFEKNGGTQMAFIESEARKTVVREASRVLTDEAE